MVLGSPRATKTLIEYASASCSHCAAWSLEVLPQLQKSYIRTGKLRLVFREILTAPVELAAITYVLARAAGSARYFAVVEGVFKAQPRLFAPDTDVMDILRRIAREQGRLTDAQITAALSDETRIKALNLRVQRNAEAGDVTGTPTFFFEGTKLTGEQDFATLSGLIDHSLKVRGA